MHLDVSQIRTLAEVRTFLEGTGAADFRPIHRADVYDCIRRTLVHFDYFQARRPDKSSIKRFLEKVTGLSRAQVTRLISQYHRTGRIVDRRRKPPANRFQRVYTAADVALLAKIDDSQNQLAGPATKVLCHRMFHVFGDEDFKRLANISNGAIYNIRKRRAYRAGRLRFRKTVATRVSIGERPTASPATSASTASTSATSGGRRAPTSSTSSTKSLNNSILSASNASPTSSSAPRSSS